MGREHLAAGFIYLVTTTTELVRDENVCLGEHSFRGARPQAKCSGTCCPRGQIPPKKTLPSALYVPSWRSQGPGAGHGWDMPSGQFVSILLQVGKLRPRDGDGLLESQPHFMSLSWPSVHSTGHPHASPLCHQHLNNLEFVS